MFRSQYDGDISTWSPQGRIHQIEYAMEAVKQGSACVGLKSKKFSVIAALKRSSSELGSYQKKIFRIDDHVGIAIAGLTADARVLSKYMRTECLNYKFVYEAPLQVGRLVSAVADKSQVHTQRYGRRPYGVGLLVIGYDQTGPHLYETSPSGNFYDYKAMAIGARSQSAKTYMEKHFQSFENLSSDELIKHALLALRETIQSSSDGLTAKNCSVGIVGENHKLEILEGDKLNVYLAALDDASSSGSKMEE
jgi:20S proteasome subunit alpha 6